MKTQLLEYEELELLIIVIAKQSGSMHYLLIYLGSVWEAFNDLNESIRLEENYMKTNRKKNRLLLQSVIDAVTSMAAEIHHLGGGEFDVIRELDFDDSTANLLPSGDSEDDEDESDED